MVVNQCVMLYFKGLPSVDTDTNICWITPDFPLYLVVNKCVMLYLKRMSSVDADTNIRCFTADFPLYLVVNQCVMLHLKKPSVDSDTNRCIMLCQQNVLQTVVSADCTL